MGIDSSIQTAFNATQVILVFLSVLFGIRYNEFKKLLSTYIPTNQRDLEDFCEKIEEIYKDKCLVLLGINIAVFIIFLPILINVIWNAFIYILKGNHLVYNFTEVSFVFINLMILGLIYWTYRLSKEIKSFKGTVQKNLKDYK